MKKLILFLIIIFVSTYAYAGEYKMTGSIPAPGGRMTNVTFDPRNAVPVACGADSVGTMYYSSVTNRLEICTDKGGGTYDYEPIASMWVRDDTVNPKTVYLKDTDDSLALGTTAATFKLTLENDGGGASDSGIIALSTQGQGETLPAGSEGVGTKFIWYPKKAAFRAGYVDGTQWDDSEIGSYSMAGGASNIAKGVYSAVVAGVSNRALSNSSFIGGGFNNIIDAAASNSVIAGGTTNKTFNQNDTIGGGVSNEIRLCPAGVSTISGGWLNIIDIANAAVVAATIGGGWSNSITGGGAVIAGGIGNTASGGAGDGASWGGSSIGGGVWNIASGEGSRIGGGVRNQASGKGSFVGGGGDFDEAIPNPATQEFNVASGNWSAVTGGYGNTASSLYATIGGGHNNKVTQQEGTIGGGENNVINAGGGWSSTIAGGQNNTVVTQGMGAFIGGGDGNTAGSGDVVAGGGLNYVNSGIVGPGSTIGGGGNNTIADNIYTSTIAGGGSNSVSAIYSTIGGGSSNAISASVAGASTIAGGTSNSLSQEYSFIGGGTQNASGSDYSVIGGGGFNFIGATADFSVIAGGGGSGVGTRNTIDTGPNQGDCNAILGGELNTISGDWVSKSTIGGGHGNTINGEYSFIGGGFDNKIQNSAYRSAIPWGMSTKIDNSHHSIAMGENITIQGGSDYSFVLGNNTTVNNSDRTFVWGDNGTNVNGVNDAFLVGPSGNITMAVGTNNPDGRARVHINALLKLSPIANGDAPACDGSAVGLIFASENGVLCFCSGAQWENLIDSGAPDMCQ